MACEFCGTCYRELDLKGFDLCQFNSNDSGCFGTHAGSAYHKTHIDIAYVAHKHTDLGVIQFSHKRSDYLANGINSPRYLFEILWSSHHSLDTCQYSGTVRQATDSLTKRLKTRIAHNKEGEPF